MSVHNNKGLEAKHHYIDQPFLLNQTIQGLNFGDIYSELVVANDYPYYSFESSDFSIDAVVVSGESSQEIYFDPEKAGIIVDDNGDITIDTNSEAFYDAHYDGYADVSVHFTVTDPDQYTDTGTVNFTVENKLG